MTAYLNYLIEANLGLLLFLMVYRLFLQPETNFQFKRYFLLTGIIVSLMFPLIHFNLETNIVPIVQDVIPSYWLPEVIVGNATAPNGSLNLNAWEITGYIYLAGLLLFMLRFFIQLGKLSRIIKTSEMIRVNKFRIALSDKNRSTFSFFHFIFVGQSSDLSEDEKQQIIQHESVHARQWHSLDIVLINILGIMFWFNPFIRTYKNILVQLHEFEADAHVAESRDKDEYCSLLAKVALRSANLTLANYFNNSLTLKRISMMRTIKQKIKTWKIVTLLAVLPLVFFILSCQDQLIPDSLQTNNLPAEAESRFAQFRQSRQDYPGTTFIVEYFDSTDPRLNHPDKVYVELFTIQEKGKQRNFAMMQYLSDQATEKTSFSATAPDKAAFSATQNEEIFTVVEHSPEYEGGFSAMIEFISRELKYPGKARSDRKEGTVFVQFIVEKDGSLSNVEVIRGVEASLDDEAVRVVKLTNWKPGIQDGKAVRVRFVLPVKYQL